MEPSNAPWRVIEPVEPAPSPSAVEPAPDRPWIAIGAVLVAAAIAVAAFLLASRPEAVIEVDGATGVSDPAVVVAGAPGEAVPSGRELVVEVGGAVVRPGVYRLPSGSRVGDAIEAAGGFGARVDATLADRALNLAAVLKDGDEIRVPVRGEASPGAPAGGSGESGGGAAAGAQLDLNTASADALDTLPGVGPATAAKIIAAREEQPFSTVDDLGMRKVVGPATLEKLRPLVTVGP